MCPNGGDHFRDECGEDGCEWQIEAEPCSAAEALDEFRKIHPDIAAGTKLRVRPLAEGEEPSDPLEFDPARATAEHEAMQRRFGLT